MHAVRWAAAGSARNHPDGSSSRRRCRLRPILHGTRNSEGQEQPQQQQDEEEEEEGEWKLRYHNTFLHFRFEPDVDSRICKREPCSPCRRDCEDVAAPAEKETRQEAEQAEPDEQKEEDEQEDKPEDEQEHGDASDEELEPPLEIKGTFLQYQFKKRRDPRSKSAPPAFLAQKLGSASVDNTHKTHGAYPKSGHQRARSWSMVPKQQRAGHQVVPCKLCPASCRGPEHEQLEPREHITRAAVGHCIPVVIQATLTTTFMRYRRPRYSAFAMVLQKSSTASPSLDGLREGLPSPARTEYRSFFEHGPVTFDSPRPHACIEPVSEATAARPSSGSAEITRTAVRHCMPIVIQATLTSILMRYRRPSYSAFATILAMVMMVLQKVFHCITISEWPEKRATQCRVHGVLVLFFEHRPVAFESPRPHAWIERVPEATAARPSSGSVKALRCLL